MKSDKSLLLIPAASLVCLALAACNADTTPTATQTSTNRTNAAPQTVASPNSTSSGTDIVRAHGGGGGGSVPTNDVPVNAQTGASRPMMGTPIDTSGFDKEIARLEKTVKSNASEVTKKELAQAYLARAKALTGAQQYRSALGDYRRTLAQDPTNEDALAMQTQMIQIFQSLGREAPAPGTEPPPLPYTKQ